jgi:hypothetical protein
MFLWSIFSPQFLGREKSKSMLNQNLHEIWSPCITTQFRPFNLFEIIIIMKMKQNKQISFIVLFVSLNERFHKRKHEFKSMHAQKIMVVHYSMLKIQGITRFAKSNREFFHSFQVIISISKLASSQKKYLIKWDEKSNQIRRKQFFATKYSKIRNGKEKESILNNLSRMKVFPFHKMLVKRKPK